MNDYKLGSMLGILAALGSLDLAPQQIASRGQGHGHDHVKRTRNKAKRQAIKLARKRGR